MIVSMLRRKVSGKGKEDVLKVPVLRNSSRHEDKCSVGTIYFNKIGNFFYFKILYWYIFQTVIEKL